MSFDGSELKDVAEKTVNRVEQNCGSRMLAYQKVAAVIGVSASWLRKFVTVEGTPEPRWSVGHRLIKHYEKLCVLLDGDVRQEKARIARLLGEIHAPDVPLRETANTAMHSRRAGDRRTD